MRGAVTLLTLAFFVPLAAGASGCVSNEYVIPHDELVRLAQLPPASRGARVHAVQSIGERQAEAIEPPATFREPEPVREVVEYEAVAVPDPDEDPADVAHLDDAAGPDIHIRIDAAAGPDHVGRHPRPRPTSPRSPGGGWVGPSPGRSHGPGTVVTRGIPAGGGGSGGVRPSGGGSHLGGIGGGGGGGGGGKGMGEALVVLAVVAVAVAAFAMVGLVASEGARFDGYVEMSPDQPIHLEDAYGAKVAVPLAALTGPQAETTVKARVMDDEGQGLRLIEHVLDRRGVTFKLDFGTLAFEPDTSTQTFSGLASHIQVGYFFTPRLGLLFTAGLGGADDGIGATLTRHAFGLELQALPLAAGPVHFGCYANGGMAVLGSTAMNGTVATGQAAGGGGLLELDVTGRMALTLRAGADIAHFDTGWSPAVTVAAGVAVY